MALHFTTRILYDQQQRVAAAHQPKVKTMNTTSRFSEILKIARKNGEEFAVGYLASMIVGLEAKLKVAKKETQSAIQQLHEYVEAEGE